MYYVSIMQIVFTPEEAEVYHSKGKFAILVRNETSPDDVAGEGSFCLVFCAASWHTEMTLFLKFLYVSACLTEDIVGYSICLVVCTHTQADLIWLYFVIHCVCAWLQNLVAVVTPFVFFCVPWPWPWHLQLGVRRRTERCLTPWVPWHKYFFPKSRWINRFVSQSTLVLIGIDQQAIFECVNWTFPDNDCDCVLIWVWHAGMNAAQGILTAKGGMTSHAAVVARGWGKPCVCGWVACASVGWETKANTQGLVYEIMLSK